MVEDVLSGRSTALEELLCDPVPGEDNTLVLIGLGLWLLHDGDTFLPIEELVEDIRTYCRSI